MLKVTLTKGSIDSVWIDRIEIRLEELTASALEHQMIYPINIHNRGDKDHDYWEGEKSDFYTISIGEEAYSSVYTTVSAQTVVSAELLVLGTRLFYGIENKFYKRIQWRSSTIILASALLLIVKMGSILLDLLLLM